MSYCPEKAKIIQSLGAQAWQSTQQDSRVKPFNPVHRNLNGSNYFCDISLKSIKSVITMVFLISRYEIGDSQSGLTLFS